MRPGLGLRCVASLACIPSGQRRARLLRGAWHGWAVILESICFKQLSILLSSHLRRRSAVLLRYISKLCPVGDLLGAGWENRVWFWVCVRKSRPQGDLRRPHAGVADHTPVSCWSMVSNRLSREKTFASFVMSRPSPWRIASYRCDIAEGAVGKHRISTRVDSRVPGSARKCTAVPPHGRESQTPGRDPGPASGGPWAEPSPPPGFPDTSLEHSRAHS